jgi:hypothetical protein
VTVVWVSYYQKKEHPTENKLDALAAQWYSLYVPSVGCSKEVLDELLIDCYLVTYCLLVDYYLELHERTK